MAYKTIQIYILIVLSGVFILPCFYFFASNFKVTDREAKNNSTYLFFHGSDNKELFARVYQSDLQKPYLIFLNDNAANNNYLNDAQLSDTLKNLYNLVFPDYRNTGKSERFRYPYAHNLEHYLTDIDSLISHLHSSSIYIVSQGFGSILAQKYIALNPTKIKQQILINPFISYDESAKRGAKKIYEFLGKSEPDTLHSSNYYEMYGYSIDDEVGFFGSSKIMALLDYYKLWYVDTLNADKNDVSTSFKSGFYTEEEYRTIYVPTLTIGILYPSIKHSDTLLLKSFVIPSTLIFGQQDVFSDRAFFEKENLKNTIIYSLPNSGHYPQVEEKDAVVQIIKNLVLPKKFID